MVNRVDYRMNTFVVPIRLRSSFHVLGADFVDFSGKAVEHSLKYGAGDEIGDVARLASRFL